MAVMNQNVVDLSQLNLKEIIREMEEEEVVIIDASRKQHRHG